MSEKSVIVPIEKEDLLGAENNDDDGENGEKVLSEFEEFANYWRSSVRVTNAILQYRQYNYLNILLSYNNLMDFVFDDWRYYTGVWYVVSDINKYLLDKLKKTQTSNVLEEEQKNKDIKYLNDLRDLVSDIGFEKRIILTPLPPVPRLNLQETTSFIKNKGESKYKRIFHNLLHFCIIISEKEFSRENLLKQLTILFKNISSLRQQFHDQEECFKEVSQRWEDLQQFLRNYFNDNPKKMQQIEPKYTKEDQQTSEFYLFLQSFLRKDKLKWSKEIDQLLNGQYGRRCQNSNKHFITDNVEQLFLMLLLDTKYDFKNIIKVRESTIQKTLNDNFLKQWRRALDVPMTLLQIQQYQIHCYDLEKDQSKEWASKKKAIDTFKDIIRKIINYVINTSIRVEILKNTSIILESIQLIQDSEYLNNLLKIVQELHKDKRNILLSLPQIPNLKVFIATQSPISESVNPLSDAVFHLYHFYILIDENSKTDFCEWNEEMFINVSKNINSLDNFIRDYCKNENEEKDVLLLWEEFKIFLNENKNSGNNVMKTRVEGQNRFIEFNRIISDKDLQCEVEFQLTSPYSGFKTILNYDKIHEMQIYIVLLLHTYVNKKIDIENQKKLNPIIISTKIFLQLLLNQFGYLILKSIITNFEFDVNEITPIVDYIEMLRKKCDKEKYFLIYNDLLTKLNSIFQNNIQLRSIEVLEEIENMQNSISILKDEDIDEAQKIMNNLYCFWRLFVQKRDFSKKSFCTWNKKMFNWILLHLQEIDLYLEKLIILDGNEKVAKLWNDLKMFLLQWKGLDETDLEEVNKDSFFASFLNHDNLFLPNQIEDIFNSINREFQNNVIPSGIDEYEMLLTFILLDVPCSLKDFANCILEQNMSFLNVSIFCNQFNYLKILNITKYKECKMNKFKFKQFENDIKLYKTYLNVYEKLNNDSSNIMNCLKEINEQKIEEDIFFLDDIPQLPNNNFQLIKNNNLFTIQFRQILYLEFYFKNTTVNILKRKKLSEKVEHLLLYIYKNIEKMDEFTNSYFKNSRNIDIFKENYNLIKEEINQLPLEKFINTWNLLIHNCKIYEMEEYFPKLPLHKSEVIAKIDEEEAAKHVLLILLNVPLNEILKNQHNSPFSLDELFSFTCRYKELKSHLDDEDEREVISTQMDLTTKKLITKLKEISEISEGKKEYAQFIEFAKQDEATQILVIEYLTNVFYYQKNGYFIIFLKLLFSLFPLFDIICDMILAIKFIFSNELDYFFFTIGIVFVSGMSAVIMEEILRNKSTWKPKYCVTILSNNKWIHLLTFIQVTIFLRIINEMLLRLKMKRREKKSDLYFINYGDPDIMKKETATVKYVEICLEAIPQAILQLYIILSKNKSDPMQLLSILSCTCSAMVIVWSYISSRDPKKDPSFINNRIIFLRELCFYGLRIISASLILFIFSWLFFKIWIILRYFLDFAIGISIGDYKTNNYGLFNGIHSDLLNMKIYNIFTLVEFIVAYFIFAFNFHNYADNIYYGTLIFSVYPVLFLTWMIILYLDNFVYSVNVKPTKRIFNI